MFWAVVLELKILFGSSQRSLRRESIFSVDEPMKRKHLPNRESLLGTARWPQANVRFRTFQFLHTQCVILHVGSPMESLKSFRL